MDDTQRNTPSYLAGDRDSLAGFLQYQRETLAWKCSGLTADQLRMRAVPPSELSLLGLVRHMAEVEQIWFRHVVAGEPVTAHWGRREPGYYAEFDVDSADPDEAFRVWREQCACSRATLAGAASLDSPIPWREETFTLRYVLTHMIEEYARHNGHADLLRECVDGATGE